MQRWHLLNFGPRGLCLLAILLFGVCSRRVQAQSHTHLYEPMPGRVVFKLRPQYSQIAPADALATLLAGVQPLRCEQRFPKTLAPVHEGQTDLRTIYTLTYNAPIDPRVLARRLAKSPYLLWAEAEYAHQLMYNPADPDTSAQWYIDKISARAGWDIQRGDSTMIVAIIDTGTDWQHEDLVGNIAYNRADPINGVDDDQDGFIDNFHGWDLAGADYLNPQPDNDPSHQSTVGVQTHGTKVAGLAGASPDNNKGGTGSGLYCRILPIKAAADNDASARILKGYDGIVYAADHGAKVINCSWGSPVFTQLGKDVVDYAALTRNALVVAAAGNVVAVESWYPAAHENALSVAALDQLDQVATTRDYTIDIASPGSSFTTDAQNTYYSLGTAYSSFAAPITSGCAALVRKQFPAYSARQVAERLRATADDISAVVSNQPLKGLYGKGRLNLHAALSKQTPAIRYTSLLLTDEGDNIFSSGDTLKIVGSFRNWLDPCVNLTVTLASPDTNFIELLGTSSNIGSLATMAVKGNNSQPFRFRIRPGVNDNRTITLWIQYADPASDYTDMEAYTLLVNPTFVNVNVGTVQTSFNGSGSLGFNDYPDNRMGLGARYAGVNALYEGGFMLGNRGSLALNTLHNDMGTQDADWVMSTRPSYVLNGPMADHEGHAQFSDAGAGSQGLGMDVKLHSLAFASPQESKFILLRYTLTNQHPQFVRDSLFAALFADWDVDQVNGSTDSGSFYLPLRMAYAWGRKQGGVGQTYLGIVALEDGDTVVAYTGNMGVEYFSDTSKFNWMNSQRNFATLGNKDLFQVLGVGPFRLFPGQQRVVAFALVGGDTRADLLANATKAQQRYRCLFYPPAYSVNLGPDTVACASYPLSAAQPWAQTFVWSTGATSATTQATTSGKYWVLVTDTNGCVFRDTLQLNISPAMNRRFGLNTTDLNVGDSLIAADTTAGALSWDYNFGNGYGASTPRAAYAYPQQGSYTFRAIISNGGCTDTVYYSITVHDPLGTDDLNDSDWRMWPNPSSGTLQLQPPAGFRGPVQLLDATGRLLWQQQVDGPCSLDLHHLATGLYWLKPASHRPLGLRKD